MGQTPTSLPMGSLTWEARYTILLTQGFALAVSVDLGNNDLVFGVFKCIREQFVIGCEIFAVATTRLRHFTERL